VNPAGEKLSKQTRAAALEAGEAPLQLWRALSFLGQDPPPALKGESVAALWIWARGNWSGEKVPRRYSIGDHKKDL